MKYHQIVNALFIGLIVVCIQAHSLNALDEVANKNGKFFIHVINLKCFLIILLKKDEKMKDLIKIRDYLKALNELNMDQEELVSDEKPLHVDEQAKLNEDDSEDKITDSSDETSDTDKRSAYLRFGKRSYLRFGRNPNLGFLRFGKRSPSSFLRFGKRSPAYLRFGRSVE